MSAGAMVLSFDFELVWGLRTGSDDVARSRRLQGVRDVVARLLEILNRYEISASWATVGHLMLRDDDCPDGRYEYDLPAPRFPWFHGGWYDDIPRLGEAGADAYYAPDLVRAIVESTAYQEIASHTFSHVPLGDPACTLEVARAELERSRQVAAAWNRRLTSMVFPRNVVGHVPLLAETGFRCYRAKNSEWYWFGRPTEIHRVRAMRLLFSGLRLVDEWICLTPPLPPVRSCSGVWEIPHSMFFPGFRGVSKFVPAALRARRAIRGLDRAVAMDRVFSMYTHPHNFLPDPDRLLPAFDAICRHAARLRDEQGLQILTMGELAEQLDAGDGQSWIESAQAVTC